METQSSILLSLKTQYGFEHYGQFFLGPDEQEANRLFESLKGSNNMRDNASLHIDLMATAGDLPVKVKSICCTLDELACNVKLISREVFRLKNLKAYEE